MKCPSEVLVFCPLFINYCLNSYLHLRTQESSSQARWFSALIVSTAMSITTNAILLASEGNHRSRTRLLGKIPSKFTVRIKTGFKNNNFFTLLHLFSLYRVILWGGIYIGLRKKKRKTVFVRQKDQ